MPGYSVEIEGQPLELWYSAWSPREKVTWAGRAVSDKRSFAYPVSRHVFALPPEAGAGEVEVRLAGPLGYVVRKDGVVMAERDRPWMRFFVSFGLIYLVAAVFQGLLNLILTLGGASPWIPFGDSDFRLLAALLGSIFLTRWTKREIRGENRGRNAAVAAGGAPRLP